MLKSTYTKSYIYIYLWHIISIVLGLASIFVVVPYLSSNSVLYGIYSICVTLMMFYSYADIGFLSAGQKFAAEYYAQGERRKEISVLSFTAFLILLFFFVISLVLMLISFNPNWVIKNIVDLNELKIFRSLVWILIVSFPVFVAQRILMLTYAVKLEDFRYQRFVVIGNLTKILSVFLFFSGSNYMLVEYFLALHIINLLVVICGCIDAKRRYKYSWTEIRDTFSEYGVVFKKVRPLAAVSFLSALCWFVYYEIDNFVVSSLLGVEKLAIYAIALAILTAFRTFLGALFTPFTSRFNHLIGEGNIDGLNSFFYNIATLLFPIIVFPIIIVGTMADSFVISWVGEDYVESIPLLKVMVYCNIFAFISYLNTPYMMGLQKVKPVSYSAILGPVIFWGGVFVTINHWGLYSFGFWKMFSMCAVALFLYFYVSRIMKRNYFELFLQLAKNYAIPLIATILLSLFAKRYMISEHNNAALIINVISIFGVFVFSYGISVLTCKQLRQYIFKLLKITNNESI